jgi:hypothetical protein
MIGVTVVVRVVVFIAWRYVIHRGNSGFSMGGESRDGTHAVAALLAGYQASTSHENSAAARPSDLII